MDVTMYGQAFFVFPSSNGPHAAVGGRQQFASMNPGDPWVPLALTHSMWLQPTAVGGQTEPKWDMR
jgi:hypothetical protein